MTTEAPSESALEAREVSALRKQDFLTLLGLLAVLGSATAAKLVLESNLREGGLHGVALSSAYRHLNEMTDLAFVRGEIPEQWNEPGRPQTEYSLTERGTYVLHVWRSSRNRLFDDPSPAPTKARVAESRRS